MVLYFVKDNQPRRLGIVWLDFRKYSQKAVECQASVDRRVDGNIKDRHKASGLRIFGNQLASERSLSNSPSA